MQRSLAIRYARTLARLLTDSFHESSSRNITISTCNHYGRRNFSSTQDNPANQSDNTTTGILPNWIKSKLPTALGGNREEISELDNFDLDAFASSARNARRLGSLKGFASGTASASDAAAQGNLRLFENIVGAMTSEEKADLSIFGSDQRQRVATEVECTIHQVDDCVARYLWTKQMSKHVAERRKKGLPMPTSIDELEKLVGTWRQYKQEHSASLKSMGHSSGSSGGGMLEISIDAVDGRGRPCGLAGMAVSKNTKCSLTRKAYKACCGKKK